MSKKIRILPDQYICTQGDAASTAFLVITGSFAVEMDNKKVGSISTMTGFSFGPDKNLNTGEGGLIVTNDNELAEKCKILRKNGADRRYHHVEIGWNAKMPDPNAALGISQLKRIDKDTKSISINSIEDIKILENEI